MTENKGLSGSSERTNGGDDCVFGTLKACGYCAVLAVATVLALPLMLLWAERDSEGAHAAAQQAGDAFAGRIRGWR